MRPHQQEAHDKVVQALGEAGRATIVMPPGSGKTLVGLRVAETLTQNAAGCAILVLVPSLILLDQVMRDWVNNTCWDMGSFQLLPVGSGQHIAEFDEDSLSIDPHTMLERPTTDPGLIQEFLSRGGRKLVFCTYHSALEVQKAAVASRVRFAFAIFDEAHHCTQQHESLNDRRMFTTAVAEDFPIDRRLFMTATPRQVGAVIGKGETEQRQEMFAMSDPSKFGEIVHRLRMSEAIKAGIIVPFEIVLCRISRKEFRKEELRLMSIDNNNSIEPKGSRPLKGSWALKLIATQRAMEGLGLKKVFTFHNLVDHAKEFVSEAAGLPAVGYQGAVFTMSAETSGVDRHQMFQDFAQAESAVMSNCRCLSEGVDAPEVDGVAFIDAKKSAVDIVQAAGRAFRKVVGSQKQKAYILLPLIVDEGQGEEEITATLQASEFSYLGEVLAALLDEGDDEEIWDYFVSSSWNPVSSGPVNPGQTSRFSEISSYFGTDGLLTVFDGNSRAIMPAGKLRDAIKRSVVKPILSSFERNLSTFRDFSSRFGSGYVPSVDTSAGRQLLSDGWPNSFLKWAEKTRAALRLKNSGTAMFEARRRRLEDSGFRLEDPVFQFSSRKPEQHKPPAYAQQVRYCEWEPLMSAYAVKHCGQLPSLNVHFVTVHGHRQDLGKAIRNRLRYIQSGLMILEKDKFAELFIRLGWLDNKWSKGKSRTT
ncbi:unnamed protein product [Polarella glacialis]|uniref:DNA helicase n=1 Tax=Polarella glacialis TaxID=89957 RepID=A0A813G905_POLGL|nr:unnamed protein product [Polarella glacialis]